jgi:uncharacterized protein (TIGR02453 family)
MPKKSKTPELPKFTGFPTSLFQFLRELAENNDRDWFAENKQRYEDDVATPALSFIAAMEPKIKKLSPFLNAIPKKMGGSMTRIYRDTRFSKNKDPYKANVGIHFRHQLGADMHAPGLYVHLEPGECFLAAGTWMPPSEALGMIRQVIDEEPKEWKKVLNHKAFRSRYKLEGESLKTAPKGYAKDHPMIEHLNRKSCAGVTNITQKDLYSAKCVDLVAASFKDAQPLMRFICDALNLSY